MNLALNAWLAASLGPQYTAVLTGIASTPKPATGLSLDFSSLLGPLFFSWLSQLLLPVMMSTLVLEKERRWG